ncbi:DNA-directed RNA polymerase, RpoE2, archaeal [mine drainage metagenome]|uniref:DNA-directed RNA polymerase, RpoE2, archaeal n=1 Tax=mine drainage metagenome TaxID=410659 RepID=T0ZM17_9ZZZZ
MKPVYKACKVCKRLTSEKLCPYHGDSKMSSEWFGFIIVSERKNSIIAKRAAINDQGIYAIKVR